MTPKLPGDWRAAAITSILAEPVPQSILSCIAGNAPTPLKELPIKWYEILGKQGETAYGHGVRKRLEVKEVSLEPSQDDPEGEKRQAKIICELDVLPDMCDAKGVLDHGCMSFLLDEGSAISLVVVNGLQGGPVNTIGVSQTFNVLFHADVTVGSRIRIVNRSVATEKDVGCCRSEIWDIANHRLVVSGVQIQMLASKAP